LLDEEEIARYEARWSLGTRERLSLDLLLYTGLARGDVVRLGKQHVSNGVITFHMEKNRGDDGYVYPPVLPPLATSIAATKTGDLIYLVSTLGTPYTKESFGNWFREKCTEPVVRLSARSAQSGRHPLRREWRDGQPADGAVRVEDREDGASTTPRRPTGRSSPPTRAR